MTGLPPTLEEIEDFLNDRSPDAYEVAIDRLLASPRYGERMINGEGGRLAEENRIDYLVDQTDSVSTIWMGVTMACARCHDHKYDPISQRKYYQLMAFFDKTEVTGKGRNPQTPPVLDLRSKAHHTRLEELEAAKVAAGEVLDAVEQKLFPREEGELTITSEKARDIKNGTIISLFMQPVQKRRPEPLIRIAHDFQATILHLLGIDHERLTYKYQGRNFHLTDVHGHVVKDILA